MVFRAKGFFSKKIIDENCDIIALIENKVATKDTLIFILLTNKMYTSHFDMFVTDSDEKNQKLMYHQYIIKEGNKSIAIATVSFKVFNNIKSCEFTYLNSHYCIIASNKFFIDKFDIYCNEKIVATTCVRAFSHKVESNEITDPLLICIFYIFSLYIQSEHEISG